MTGYSATRKRPFGNTRVTADEIAESVNREAAVALLADNGVTEPEHRVTAFIQRVPALLAWLESSGRHYPWRETTDPWRVFVAEILLRRTRADAVLEVYDAFFDEFPDAAALHAADDSDVHELIEHLGFGNQRTRTLTEAAALVDANDGDVPRDLDELKRPFRIGPYTARATLLFGFDDPHALVDTNFARIIERVFGYEMPAQPSKSDAVYQLLEALVPSDPAVARAFNLAMLDLGGTVCTSSNPGCGDCPLRPACRYAAENSDTSE